MVFMETHSTESDIYKDLSGPLPFLLRAWNHYIFIIYNKGINVILETDHKDRYSSTLRAAYVKIIKTLHRVGFKALISNNG